MHLINRSQHVIVSQKHDYIVRAWRVHKFSRPHFSHIQSFKGAVPCLPRELTTLREVVYKQCSHMRRGRNTCFNRCHVLRVVGRYFSLGFFAQSFWLEMEEPIDNSQSIMSDDSTYSSQYSWPIAVLKVFQPFHLTNRLFCTVNDG